jgi:hypothetical protein
MKKSYVEPEYAPAGVPCRFCDLPKNVDGFGEVYQDGIAVDGQRPLYSHKYCLMNSGGKRSDNYDFSLQGLLPENLRSHYENNLKNNNEQFLMAASTQPEEDNIWAFSFKNRFVAHPEPDNLTKMKKTPPVKDLTREDKTEEYADDGTGAPIPPSI